MFFALTTLRSVLGPLLGPAGAILSNLIVPFLSDKAVKMAAYKMLESAAKRYEARAKETKDESDDAIAASLMWCLNTLKNAWGI